SASDCSGDHRSGRCAGRVACPVQCRSMGFDSREFDQVFADLSRSAFAPYPDFPSGLWVSMHPFQDPDSLVGVLTMGLSNFIGREIELEGEASQLEALLTTAHGVATYLLQDGVELRDGDTVGASATERIPIRFMESRRFEGLPLLRQGSPSHDGHQ